MRTVILAAGDGGRLGHHTAAVPKPLVRIAGRPLVDYTIDALAASGVGEIHVVTGYREAQVRASLGRRPATPAISFATNTRFTLGASLSLRAARPFCGDEPFLLVMSDHLLSRELIERLLDAAHVDGRCYVAADFGERDLDYADEATKLRVDQDGRVTAIGKRVGGWNALDTGAFLLSPAAWEAVDAVEEDCELSVIFSELARRGGLYAADVSGCFWYDVDTVADLAAAGELLTAGGAGAA